MFDKINYYEAIVNVVKKPKKDELLIINMPNAPPEAVNNLRNFLMKHGFDKTIVVTGPIQLMYAKKPKVTEEISTEKVST